MKFGIDFGTSYTKIAYLDDNDQLKLFRFPGEKGHEYIPTAIAYHQRKNKIWIGDNANRKAMNQNAVFYNNFKMRLPMTSSAEWEQDGWLAGHSPSEVTKDYFSNLLLNDKLSLKKYLENPDRVVVSVPELWYQDIQAPGPSNLLSVFRDIGINVDRLHSEPICAAAYFAFKYSQKKSKRNEPYNLLICDIGGGTMDIALCHIRSTEIVVLEHAGSGEKGLQAAGVAFDRACMLAAYQNTLKQSPPDLESKEFFHLLTEFEKEKISDPDEMSALLREADIDILGDTPIYEISDGYNSFQVTLQQVMNAFSPIDTELRSILSVMKKRSEDRGLTIDQVLVVGGFGQYPLVQDTIYNALQITPSDSRWSSFTPSDRFYAIAYGASLLAQDKVQTIEPYPHTLGILTRRIINGKPKTSNTIVLQSGHAKAGMLKPEYAIQSNGSPLIVRVDGYKSGDLPVYVQANGIGEICSPTNISQTQFPPDGRYEVGFQIDQSRLVTLIFRNFVNQNEYKYDLEKLDLAHSKETTQ
jgi:molecular chaperone DnaK